MSQKILFEKYQATENDFIFIKRAELLKNMDAAKLAKVICQRKSSVGADGLVLISEFKSLESTAHFRWDFYNDDGSRAAMCGNAARCATLFAFYESGLKDSSWQTDIGELQGQWHKDQASVTLPLADIKPQECTLNIEGRDWTGLFVDSGVPHFVVIQQKYAPPESSIAQAIQSHSFFGSAQTNVTFVEAPQKGHSRFVSYERGIRDYTRACGTGAIACAMAFRRQDGHSNYSFLAPGGPLSVTLKPGFAQLFGPSQRVFKGSLEVHA